MAKRPRVNLIDEGVLSEDEKAQLRAEARAAVDAEQKALTREQLLRQYIAEERRKRDPQEEMKYITLDLAGHSDRIMLDGIMYMHGIKYAVPKSKFDTLREIVARGWKHEDEVGGANRDQYQRPRDTHIRNNGYGEGIVTNAPRQLGAV